MLENDSDLFLTQSKALLNFLVSIEQVNSAQTRQSQKETARKLCSEILGTGCDKYSYCMR